MSRENVPDMLETQSHRGGPETRSFWRLVVFGIAGLLVVSGLCVFGLILGLPPRQQPSPGLPDDSEITSMEATLFQSPIGFSSIPEFSVPSDHIPTILFWFRPNAYDNSPPVLPANVVGELTIHSRGEQVTVVRLYSAGHNPPLFTTNGQDFFWGGGAATDDGWALDGGIQAGKAIEKANREAAVKGKE